MYQGIYGPSVVLEWIIALFFAFYMSSFAIDFLAVHEIEQAAEERLGSIYVHGKAWDEEKAIAIPAKSQVVVEQKEIQLIEQQQDLQLM